MPVLLIATAGGSPEPLIKSLLLEPQAERVFFVCSQESKLLVDHPNGILAKCRERGLVLSVGQYEFVEVSDPQDLKTCVAEIERQVASEVARWRRRGEDYVVHVDPTGGTKPMAIALAFAARRWPCEFRYIGGSVRTKDGLGTVIDSAETPLLRTNPLDVLGHHVIDDALALARRMDFASAKAILELEQPAKLDSPSRTRIKSLGTLLEFFSLWDCFEHRKAAQAVAPIANSLDQLRSILSEDCCRLLERNLPGWELRLQTLAEAEGPTAELIEDLIANAERRASQARFDDATARLYRATEAIAQLALWRRGIDSSRVRLDQFPPDFPEAAEGRKLGLQEAYRLLQALHDPVGKVFSGTNLPSDENRRGSPLNERNQSILGHGFKPISERSFKQLRESVEQLARGAGLQVGQVVFPELRPRHEH